MRAASSFAWRSVLALGMELALAAVSFAADAPPAPRRYTTDAWIAAADKAFARKRPPLKPAGLIFPVVEETGRIRADGRGISHVAMLLATFTPARRTATSVLVAEDVFDAANLSASQPFDAERVKLCCRAAEARWYVLPKLTPQSRGYKLTIFFHGNDDALADRETRYDVPFDDLREVPVLIARDVRAHLGIEDKNNLVDPLSSERDFLALCRLWLRRRDAEHGDTWLRAMTGQNRHSVIAWEAWLRYAADAEPALADYQRLRHSLACPHLDVLAARRLRERNQPEDALLLLLRSAPAGIGDPAYHAELLRSAMSLKEDRLVEHLLSQWEQISAGYAHRLERSRVLIEWAWQARGDGWAFTVTPEGWRLFGARLRQAREESEQALATNADGWMAHVALVTVARGLGLPRQFMEEHFRAAIKLQPRCWGAYWAKMEYLKPRWHGTADDLLAFAQECIATGYWAAGVPRLVPEMVWDLCLDPESGATLTHRFRRPEIWRLAQTYYREAYRHGRHDDRIEALNYLALWGVYGEHYEEAAVALQKAGVENLRHDIIGEFTDVFYLQDLVHARTGRLAVDYTGHRNDRELAAAGTALAEGKLDEAEQHLQAVSVARLVASHRVTNYQAALKLGRRLAEQRSMALTPDEVLAGFVGDKRLWRVEGNRLACDIGTVRMGALEFPVGLGPCVITGTVEWSGGISHVEVRAHTRAPRDRLVMRYLPDRRVVLLRDYQKIEESTYQPGPQRFRLEFGSTGDRLQPHRKATWEAGVFENVPSGFGFKAGRIDSEAPATFYLSNIRIERKTAFLGRKPLQSHLRELGSTVSVVAETQERSVETSRLE